MIRRLFPLLALLLGFAALAAEPNPEAFLKELSPPPKAEAPKPSPSPLPRDSIVPGTYRWFALTGKDGKAFAGPTTWYANGEELVESKDAKGNRILSADLPNAKVLISDAAGWIMGDVSGVAAEAPRYDIPEKAVVVYGKRAGGGTLTLVVDTVVTVEKDGKQVHRAKRLLTKVYSISGVPPDDGKKKDEGKKDEGKKDEGKKDEGKKDEGKKAEHVYIAILHDGRNLQPEFAQIFNNTSFWDSWKTKGHKAVFFDINPPPGKTTNDAIEKGYVNLASKIQTGTGPYKPAMLLLDWDTGKLLREPLALSPLTEPNEKVIKEVAK